MASGTELSNTLVSAMLDNAVNVLLNEGLANGIVNIYTGAVPTDCETAPTGTLLGTCVLNSTPFGAAADLVPGAQITANTVVDDIAADAAGVAGYFRAYSSDSGTDASKLNCHIQGTAGEAADSTDLTLDNKTIVLGGTISVTAWTINMPES